MIRLAVPVRDNPATQIFYKNIFSTPCFFFISTTGMAKKANKVPKGHRVRRSGVTWFKEVERG